jgi:hypothetical protein
MWRQGNRDRDVMLSIQGSWPNVMRLFLANDIGVFDEVTYADGNVIHLNFALCGYTA